MDAIQNLVSGTDPFRTDASAVPDGEEALRRMFSEPAAFTDTMAANVVPLAERRHRRAKVAGLLTIAAAAVTAGVLVSTGLGSLSPAPAPANTAATTATATESPAATPTPSPTATATESPAATPTPSATSTRFEFDSGKGSFSLPVGWTAKEVPAGTAESPAIGIDVFDEANKRVAGFRYGAAGGVGGACGPEHYTVTELDTGLTSLNEQWSIDAGARFSYRVLDQTSVGKGFSYQVGLVDKSSGELTDSCLMYSFVGGAPKGTLSFADRAFQGPGDPGFATMEEAKAYMGTPEYRKLKAMIRSLTLAS
jgi:hypothetical protein